MSARDAALILTFYTGALLLLSGLRSFSREPRRARIAPYLADRALPAPTSQSATPVAAVLAPLAEALGSRLARMTGIRRDLPARLTAAGSEETPTGFRMKQFVHALIALGLSSVLALSIRPGPVVSLAMLCGLPVLVVLAHEQRLESRIESRRLRTETELPVVTEQIAVLLAAGMSLGATLERIARRGNGVVAAEIAEVQRQVRQGDSEMEALRAWAERARCIGVDRLVAVLAMHRDAADLGALLATESRSIRAAAHRRLVESIERRSQLVWVPVTVATLIPGLILIGVPFVSAMGRITG